MQMHFLKAIAIKCIFGKIVHTSIDTTRLQSMTLRIKYHPIIRGNYYDKNH